MAKPFYSLEEVSQVLGKTIDEVKSLVRSGTLREFRDAGKVYFKAADVDKLAQGARASGGSGEILLEPADDELPRMPDVTSGGTSVIGLQPVEDEPATPARGPAKAKDDTSISGSGLGVLDDEVDVDADPMAKTTITTAGPPADQLRLEGTGSGSGLLDLTREADDTSLGAELLDEIYPGEEERQAEPARRREPAPRRAEAEPQAASEPELAAVAEPVFAPVQIVGDPTESTFAGLLVGSLLLLVVAGSAVAGGLQGFVPPYVAYLSQKFPIYLAASVLIPLIGVLIGWVIGRAGAAPARRA